MFLPFFLAPCSFQSDLQTVKAEQKGVSADGGSVEAQEADRLGFIETFERTFADPVFWLLLFFLNIAAPFFFRGLYFSRLSPL